MPANTQPATGFIAVTPSDTTIIGCRALFIGTSGNLTLDSANQSNVVFKNVPSGTVLPVQALRVKAATTALDIVALY